MITLGKILDASHVFPNLRAGTYREALHELLAGLDSASAAESVDRRPLIESELRKPSLVGDGICIPHFRADDVKRIDCVLATWHPPITRLDDTGEGLPGPVAITALFAVPTKLSAEYLQVVGSLARLLQDGAVRARILDARAPEALHAALFSS